MMGSVILVLVAVLIETSVVSVAAYLIAVILIYMRTKLITTIWAAGIGGLVLDVLTPRHLGTSSLITLLILLGAEKWLGGRADKGRVLSLVGTGLIIGEGVWVGRSWAMISLGVVMLILMLGVGRGLLRMSQARQLIVRREI